MSLVEIKGAPCTMCAHFGCQVCACIFNILIPLYKEEHTDKMPGVWFLLSVHPACAQYKTVILNTAMTYMYCQKGCSKCSLIGIPYRRR